MAGCESTSIEGYDHLATRPLGQDIYFEIYSKSYGVYGGSAIKYFVTDSAGYHQYIGSCDDKEFFKGTVLENAVIVEKYTRRNMNGKGAKFLKKKSYSLSE
jgi:hypothetical protein